MTQAVIAGQSPDVLRQLEQLQTQSAELRLKLDDLNSRSAQIRQQRLEAQPADRAIFDKQFADAQHQVSVVESQLGIVQSKLADAQHARDMMQAREAQQVLTIQPPPASRDPFDKAQLLGLETAGFVLLLPIVYALTRRILRGGRRGAAVDLENSPRLQRMEQAIESIAIEVERIGEAQRFTTKLLSERHAEPVASQLPPIQAARREPGTITPH
ncbi:MAG: hypothetical protein JF589_05300 [Gemmatimonadetes bacterium]|nr:hypothetical protein [Gemmatimonadota bacterium]